MDHVDPAAAYYMLSGQILRLFTRQLFTYPPVRRLHDWRQVTPVPDLAREIPTVGNGLLSPDHLTYTIRLRPGVHWDTEVPREVTAHDVIRGLKRMANPVLRAGAIHYYTSTIAGMAEFCDAYAAAVAGRRPTAEALADFQNTHDVPGIEVADDRTLVFRLVRPALDFVHILAMMCATPAPAEYDAYLPDSPEFRRGVRSLGPYRLVHYVHGRELRLARNPAWRQQTDPVRHQYLDGVAITMEKATPEQVERRIRSGRADLSWASPVTEPLEADPDDPGNHLGYALNPYLVFNLVGPDPGGVRRLEVRRAIAYAVDRARLIRIYDKLGAGTVMWPARSAIPPGNQGYEPVDPWPTPDGAGDPARGRALLAEAGYRGGLTLTVVHRDVDANPEVARSLADDLAAIGITARLRPLGHADYYPFLRDPAHARAGAWDLSAPSWQPDWFCDNGRAMLQPMVQTNTVRGTANYGGYSNPEVDRLIAEALSETDPGRAHAAWHAVDVRVLADVAIVPLLVHAPTIPHLRGARVRDAIAMPTIDRWFDLATLWLDPAG
jgi:peptide/nickel transport system substrate-binding protein